MSSSIPESFIQWAYEGRAKMVRQIAAGEEVSHEKLFLGFTRHNPTVISHGPAGLNGSIKGVGWLPKQAYIQDTLDAYMAHIATGWSDQYSDAGLKVLLDKLYGEACRDRIDFGRLGSLELVKDHSWKNLRANPEVTLVFYQPPVISYEVRGHVEIHEEGSDYHQLINAQHDTYHKPNVERWPSRPAYVFIIEEIFNNSASPQGYGKPIYP
jgi:hypothetical protein